MNKIITCHLILISIVFIGSACKKDRQKATINSCNLANSLKTVTGTKGVVRYNTAIEDYVVYSSIEGTYDSQDVGVSCNLPESYKKEGVEIIFNGKYYQYPRQVEGKIPGQTYYILELSTIEEPNGNSK